MEERIKGMIYGAALGDAFGMATEMLRQVDIPPYLKDMDHPSSSLEISIISNNRPAYSVTDDTMNILMILEMLKETGGVIDTDLYLKKLRHWTKDSPIAGFVTGPSTSKALTAIEKGMSIGETGKFGTTNGAAMKICPLAIVSNYRDPDQLIDNVEKICRPTHNTSVAISGACAITAAASFLLRGKSNMDELFLAYIARIRKGHLS